MLALPTCSRQSASGDRQRGRWTLVLNRDAAMNLRWSWSRWGFAVIAVFGMLLMLRLLQAAPDNAVWRAVGLGLVAAGAMAT